MSSRAALRTAAGPGLGTGPELAGISRGQPQRLAVLDSVRGIAAMVVLVHHCLLTQPAFSDFFFSTWRTGFHGPAQCLLFHTPARLVWDGYEAVTLFYVLSGLVLMLPWVEGRGPSYLAFCVKRVCRIYLPYCVAVAGSAALAVLVVRLAHLSPTVAGGSEWLNAMTWSNPVTPAMLLDHALMIGHHNTLNGAVHSLVWEMRVSLLFPVLALPLVRWRAKGALGVAACLVAFVAAAQLAFAPAGFAASGGGVALLETGPALGGLGKLALEAQWTAYYAVFFVIGATLAWYLAPIRRLLARLPPPARWAMLLAGLLVIQAHWTRSHPLQETMVALGSALVIVAALSPGAIERALMLRPLRFLGRISYSVYLVHVPLLLAAVLTLHGRVPMAVVLVCVPPASIALGWLFQAMVVDPCARLGQRLASRLRHRRTALNDTSSRQAWGAPSIGIPTTMSPEPWPIPPPSPAKSHPLESM